MAESLFEKYGGYDTVSKLVSIFYEKILADDSISGYFDNVDMEHLMKHQTAFIGMMLGGPASQYTGRDLKTAHQNLKITNEHFNRVAQHLHSSLAECGVEGQDIDTIITAVASRRADVVAE
jgi:hemoglobin